MASVRLAATWRLSVSRACHLLNNSHPYAFFAGCYAAAGAVFGTVAAPAAPAAILACNAALGTCMATICAPLLLVPFI